MQSLLRVIERHEGPLSADFRRFYGLRLRSEVLEAEYGELVDLINWLPEESAFRSVIASDGDHTQGLRLLGWTHSDDLALAQIEALRNVAYVVEAVNSTRKVKPPEPLENPRHPKAAPKKASASSMAKAMLRQLKETRG